MGNISVKQHKRHNKTKRNNRLNNKSKNKKRNGGQGSPLNPNRKTSSITLLNKPKRKKNIDDLVPFLFTKYWLDMSML